MADLTNTYMELSSFDFNGGFNILGKPEPLDSRVTVSNIAYIYEPTHWSFTDNNGIERTIPPYTGLIVGDHSGKTMICVNSYGGKESENGGIEKPVYCHKSSWKEIAPLENYNYISDFNNGWGEVSITQTSTSAPIINPSKLNDDINTQTGLSLKGAFKLFSAVPGADIELKSNNLIDLNKIDLNKITKAGTYHIHGDLMYCSNYPFTQWTNSSGGSTIDATLLVLDSSIASNPDDPNSKVVTQVLTVSKRIGDDGNIYVRTGVSVVQDSYNGFNWDKWGKLQPNTEIGIVSNSKEYVPNGSGGFAEIPNSKGLDSYTDNGIYSGVYLPNGSSTSALYIETFVVITINNSSIAGNNAVVSQFKYSLLANGNVTYKYRTANYNTTNKTFTFSSSWENIAYPLSDNYTSNGDKTGLSLTGANKLYTELRYRIDTEQEGVSQIINNLITRIEELESQLGTGSDSLATRVTALENRLSWNV